LSLVIKCRVMKCHPVFRNVLRLNAQLTLYPKGSCVVVDAERGLQLLDTELL
jgi:hypothetical protein